MQSSWSDGLMEWPIEDSITVPARRQHSTKLGALLRNVLYGLNQ